MKNPLFSTVPRKEHGGVAVEMAIVLPILVTLITTLVLFAQIFWYYGVMQKATYDAARFLSTATPVEISTPGPGNTPALVAQLAQAIAEEETSVMNRVGEGKFVNVDCDFRICGLRVPTTVRVSIEMRMPFAILGGRSMTLLTDVTMRYAGN